MLRVNASDEAVPLADGTAFLWETGGCWYLVTNLHNLSGWDYLHNKAASDLGSIPTHVEISVGVFQPHPVTFRSSLGRKGWRIELYENDKPAWLVHPAHGTQVDVAVLKMCSTPTGNDLTVLGISAFATQPVNKHDWVSFAPGAGDDAFVLGFPHAMNFHGLPIWKRASIATEPDFDLDKLPKLLIDTATRKGMSGSPVIAVRRGITMPTGLLDNESVIGESVNFLGVYSGRIGDDPMGVQLGVVWKASVIEEIIAGDVKGVLPWD